MNDGLINLTSLWGCKGSRVHMYKGEEKSFIFEDDYLMH